MPYELFMSEYLPCDYSSHLVEDLFLDSPHLPLLSALQVK